MHATMTRAAKRKGNHEAFDWVKTVGNKVRRTKLSGAAFDLAWPEPLSPNSASSK